ncbi:MAG: hypothetical protein F8N38_23345 [Hungatella sp.]|nr:hypothetical protein [Hungatella sp.]
MNVYKERNGFLIRGSSICLLILIVHLLCFCYYSTAFANSAEPPGFTIIVLNSSEKICLSLKMSNQDVTDLEVVEGERKGWEKYYRLYYNHASSQVKDLKDAVLVVQSNKKSFQCALPEETFGRYNNILTLDMESETLTMGQSPLRVPALVAMRVLLTLLIEGIIFLLFGFRQKRSWLVFTAVNLITQAGLNAMLTGPDLSNYWIFGYVFGEIVVLAAELTAFLTFVKEFRKRRIALYVITANMASLIIGGMVIIYLPV